jgi:hypothetical protein
VKIKKVEPAGTQLLSVLFLFFNYCMWSPVHKKPRHYGRGFFFPAGTYLLQELGRQTTGQSGVGLQHFLSLQSLVSFLAFAFLAGFLSDAWAERPVTSMIAIMPAIIFFILNVIKVEKIKLTSR